jgi:hypothetical protein
MILETYLSLVGIIQNGYLIVHQKVIVKSNDNATSHAKKAISNWAEITRTNIERG